MREERKGMRKGRRKWKEREKKAINNVYIM